MDRRIGMEGRRVAEVSAWENQVGRAECTW